MIYWLVVAALIFFGGWLGGEWHEENRQTREWWADREDSEEPA